jgi:hypothetical protein
MFLRIHSDGRCTMMSRGGGQRRLRSAFDLNWSRSGDRDGQWGDEAFQWTKTFSVGGSLKEMSLEVQELPRILTINTDGGKDRPGRVGSTIIVSTNHRVLVEWEGKEGVGYNMYGTVLLCG